MATKSNRKMFVNVCVADLKRSMQFFGKLGFEFNTQFTDEKAACMVVNEDAFVMLVVESFFQTFTKKAICDARTHSEALFGFSCDSRAQVDKLVNEALAAGGKRTSDPVDHGFMYVASFYDLDGHHWEALWMDPAAVAGGN